MCEPPFVTPADVRGVVSGSPVGTGRACSRRASSSRNGTRKRIDGGSVVEHAVARDRAKGVECVTERQRMALGDKRAEAHRRQLLHDLVKL